MIFADLELPEVKADPSAFIQKAEKDVLAARASYDAASATLDQAIQRVKNLNHRMGELQAKFSLAHDNYVVRKKLALSNEIAGVVGDLYQPVTRAQNEARRALEAVQFLAVFTMEDAVRDKLAADLSAVKCEAVLGESAGALFRLRLYAGATLLQADPGATISMVDADGEPTSASGKLARDVARLWQVEVPRLEQALQTHDQRANLTRNDAHATLFAL